MIGAPGASGGSRDVTRAHLHTAREVVGGLPGGPRGHQVLSAAGRSEPSSQLALAQKLGVDRTVMTYLLDELEDAGLVQRRPDPSDRRVRPDRGRGEPHHRVPGGAQVYGPRRSCRGYLPVLTVDGVPAPAGRGCARLRLINAPHHLLVCPGGAGAARNRLPSRPMGAHGARRSVTAVVAVGVMLAACSTPPPPVRAAEVTFPATTTVLGTDDPAALAVATSAALFTSAPVAVLAAADDVAAAGAAAPTAQRLGAPLLLTPAAGDPAGVGAELARLGAGTVLTVGPEAQLWAAAPGRPAAVTDEADLAPVTAPSARPSTLVLTDGAPARLAAVTTAAASGSPVATVAGADPRRAPGPRPEHVLALGTGFGSPALLTSRLTVATTGMQLPGGGQVLFPGRRMVALYGTPSTPALGVLGEQDLPASVVRAKALAARYQPLVTEPVVPAFELITTVADSVPGADGDYSAELSPAAVRPWVDAAKAAGVYVVLDLQPGRAEFLSQAKLYADLLAEPNVGLALDPEWRLGPGQVHRVQIGTVGVDEINRVVTWLADLTREKKLPQKLLMIHQFRLSMISSRERLDTSRDELSMVIHSDGFGTPAEKAATWYAMHTGAPAGIRWGWKNFVDEDRPTYTPEQTVPILPTPPAFISYQ